MDKQKQIEEMAEIALKNTLSYTCAKQIAMNFYNAGYRKIHENAVVLTREEHQKYLAFKIIEPQVRGCLDRKQELEKRLETISKETAEKYHAEITKAIESVPNATKEFTQAWKSKNDEICKKLTEGKV